MQQQKFLLKLDKIQQLVCISKNNEKFKIKEDLNDVCAINNAAVIVGLDGLIFDLGDCETLNEKYKDCTFEKTIDCTGKSVIPGLVDAHTHPVWSGDRIHEFAWKLEGVPYMEIHKKGGGIMYTVDHTRNSSEEELLELLNKRLDKMLKLGSTLVEAKSGYGLNAETEIKMLKVLKKASDTHTIEIVSNYCGAHAVPKNMTEDEATKDVIEVQIPQIKKLMDSNEINPELIDVFCEKGVFERENTRKILEAGKAIGLKSNFHGDEIKFIDSGTLGAEVEALTISHLENLDQAGIEAMADKQVCGVLLPTTHYLLKLKDPPVRDMISGGVIVALGTDFNPNAYCMSMSFVMNLACVNYKMKPNEALVASTLNSAMSMGRSDKYGSIEKNKVGDFVIIDADRWDNLIYQMGDSPIWSVVKKGKEIKF